MPSFIAIQLPLPVLAITRPARFLLALLSFHPRALHGAPGKFHLWAGYSIR
jgi:hypothetical protein